MGISGGHGSVVIDGRFDNRRLRRSLRQTENVLVKFGKRVTKIFVGVGLVILARKFFNLGKDILENYKQQIAAETRLAAVINATGAAAGFSVGQMKDMASNLQALTGVADDAILNMQAVIATFKNIRGTHFIEASKAALDLSEVLQQDLKSSALQIGKALNDPIRGINALRRAGVSFTSQQEKMIKKFMETGDIIGAQKIILQELKNEFGGAGSAVTEATKRWDGYKNRIGDVGEEMVESLAPALALVLDVVEKLVEALEVAADVLKAWQTTITATATAIQIGSRMIWDSLTNLVIGSIIATRKAFEVLWAGVQIVLLEIGLAVTKFANDVVHLFQAVIPSAVSYLQTNWIGILENISRATEQILQNMSLNLATFFLAAKGWLEGKGFNWQWTGLLEGFENTLSELPKVAERQKSATEVMMEAMLNSIKGKTGADLATFWQDVGAEIDMVKAAIGAVFSGATSIPDMPEADDTPFKVDPETDEKKKKKKKEKDNDRMGNLETLVASYDRILQSTAGRRKDPVEEAILSLKKPLVDIPTKIAKGIVDTAKEAGGMMAKIQLGMQKQLLQGVMELVTGSKEQKVEQEKSNEELTKLNKKKGILKVG